MESIGGFIAIYVIWWLFRAFGKTAKAAAKSAIGTGSFSDHMDLEFHGMKELEVRFQDGRLEAGNAGPVVKEIVGKGLFPLDSPRRIGFVTSVFDG